VNERRLPTAADTRGGGSSARRAQDVITLFCVDRYNPACEPCRHTTSRSVRLPKCIARRTAPPMLGPNE
jgi:hypothetical protein